MKKILMIILAAVLFTLTGCSGEKNAVAQEGAYTTDSYELSVPEGWMRAETQGNIVFMTTDYPETPSYIMVGTSTEKQVDELLSNKDIVIEQVKNQLTEKIGSDCNPAIDTYEEIELNGYRCVHTVLTYESDGQKVEQSQYSFDSAKGGVTFTYAIIGGDELRVPFQKSIDSIIIK